MSNERVNHPDYYKDQSNIECIDVIRNMPADVAFAVKYLWRQGKKKEEGITDNKKAAEDCNKAMWFIRDFIENVLGEECLFVDKKK